MLYDLSHTVKENMTVYPGDPPVRFDRHLSHKEHGYSVHRISMGTHTGTHIDAPYHADPDGLRTDNSSILDACAGDAYVIDVRGGINGNEITPDSLGRHSEAVVRGARILLVTGWSGMFGTEGFYRGFPGISEELAALFVGHCIALLGVETPSLHPVKDDRIHHMLLDAGIVVVECLANPGQLPAGEVFFSAVPLRLEGLDGSPVRAYAIGK